MLRYDFVDISRAEVTREGWVRDKPILARTGIQEYRRADGSVQRELRPPDEVFNAEALASLRGVPVTVGHPGHVSADNPSAIIGAVLTAGEPDGNHVTAELVIHNPKAMGAHRELSLGYSLDLDMTPGEWNGERYDAIQRNIRVNHAGVVARGRAGVARLRLDAEDAISADHSVETEVLPVESPPPPAPPQPAPPAAPPPAAPSEKAPVTETQAQPGATQNAARGDQQTQNGVLVRVDGAEVAAPIAVARELERERDRVRTATLRADKAEAERDALQAAAEQHKAELAQARQDAAASARARVKLETEAAKHGVEIRSDLNDRALREAVIRKVRGTDQRFDGKSDDYVLYAFDSAISDAEKSAEQNAKNRVAVAGVVPAHGAARADAAPGQPHIVSAQAARDRMIRTAMAR